MRILLGVYLLTAKFNFQKLSRMNVYQLSYRSKAATSFETKDLDPILASAVQNNERANISGFLIFHNNCFVQILEGSKENVISLYNTIKKDSRHHDLDLLWQGEADKKHFKEWGMTYHSSKTESEKLFINNLLLLSQLSDKSTATLLTFWLAVKEVLEL